MNTSHVAADQQSVCDCRQNGGTRDELTHTKCAQSPVPAQQPALPTEVIFVAVNSKAKTTVLGAHSFVSSSH